MADRGVYNSGDTAKTLSWVVKDRATEAILSLVGISNAIVYVRDAGEAHLIEITPTTGGALGTVTFIPGDEADIAPDVGKKAKLETWAEFDLAGKHYKIPDTPDTFLMRRDR